MLSGVKRRLLVTFLQPSNSRDQMFPRKRPFVEYSRSLSLTYCRCRHYTHLVSFDQGTPGDSGSAEGQVGHEQEREQDYQGREEEEAVS